MDVSGFAVLKADKQISYNFEIPLADDKRLKTYVTSTSRSKDDFLLVFCCVAQYGREAPGWKQIFILLLL